MLYVSLVAAALFGYVWYDRKQSYLPFPPDIRHLDEPKRMKRAYRLLDVVIAHLANPPVVPGLPDELSGSVSEARSALILVLLDHTRDGNLTDEMLSSARAAYTLLALEQSEGPRPLGEFDQWFELRRTELQVTLGRS